MLCQTYKELLISSKKESRIADMIYNRNSTAIFTYVASPTKSSAVPVSLSISLIIKSVVRSDTVKTKFSFHSGLVPFPVCQRSYICNHKQKFEPPNFFVCRITMIFLHQLTKIQTFNTVESFSYHTIAFIKLMSTTLLQSQQYFSQVCYLI